MAWRAGRILAEGRTVVADAVFDRAPDRTRIEQAAIERRTPFLGVWLDASPEVMWHRVDRRRGGPSDATVDILSRQLKRDAGSITWSRLDAARHPSEIVSDMLGDCTPGTPLRPTRRPPPGKMSADPRTESLARFASAVHKTELNAVWNRLTHSALIGVNACAARPFILEMDVTGGSKMTGKRTSRAGVYSLREIQFLRNVITAGMLDRNIQPGSAQAQRMARQVLDAYAQGVRRSAALREVAIGALPSLERDIAGRRPAV